MAIDVRMPKLSDNMEEGVIIRWMKAPGDQVSKGEALAEVETDKADVELEASESGVLREIKVAEGQSAAVGDVIAVLGAGGDAEESDGKGESAPRGEASAKAKESEPKHAREAAAKPPARSERSQPQAQEEDRAGASEAMARPRGATPSKSERGASRPAAEANEQRGANRRTVRASPLAWRLADEAGVNLASVRGSGPGGRILKRDVEAQVRGPAGRSGDVEEQNGAEEEDEEVVVGEDEGAEAKAQSAPAAAKPRETGGVVPASRMRQAIAKRMSEAKRDIPHFYVGAEIDMSEAMHLRESIKRREAMPGLTVTHLLLRALAIALTRHPRVNGSWTDAGIELHDDVNIGIAVAVEDGLVVPVLHRAQTLSLGEVVARAAQLTEKARSGKFGSADLTGGTFSLSNVGMLDVEELVAVINPPQAAILAVASVKERPIVRDGQLAVAKTMRATLSCDHRVLNGVEGGRFLEELKGILENPVTLLLDATDQPSGESEDRPPAKTKEKAPRDE